MRRADDIDMPPSSSIRLGIALNFSVFHFEIMRNPDDACRLARTALESALASPDRSHPFENGAPNKFTTLCSAMRREAKDSALILQLLQDNLELWTREQTPANLVSVEAAIPAEDPPAGVAELEDLADGSPAASAGTTDRT